MRLHRMAGAIAAALFTLAGVIVVCGFISASGTRHRSEDTWRTRRRMAGAGVAALLILGGLIALGGFVGVLGKARRQPETAHSRAPGSHDMHSEPSTAPGQSGRLPSGLAPTPTPVSWADAAQNWAVAAWTLLLTPTAPSSAEEPTPAPAYDAAVSSDVSAQPSGAAAVAANEPPPLIEYQARDVASAVLESVNSARASQGLAVWTPDTALTAAAESYAQDLADTGTFTRDGGGGTLTRVRAAGYSGGYVGEALWEGSGSYAPDQIVNEWLNSPDHRAILLAAVYTDVGVACYVVEADDSTRCVLDAGAP